jgi:uncharacterized membrane protein
MTRRMGIAMLALVGAIISLYLTLYKVGVIGTLACSTIGNCETVQLSRWSVFLGFPVASWGVGYYVAILALAVASLQERWAESSGLSLALFVLTGWGVVFSIWLTYLELFVIHAICIWCVTSAVLATILFLLALVEWRVTRVERAEG